MQSEEGLLCILNFLLHKPNSNHKTKSRTETHNTHKKEKTKENIIEYHQNKIEEKKHKGKEKMET